jgi:hypothetical protein
MTLKDTTVKIDAARRETLKDAAFEVSMELREVVSMTDILRHLIDNYTKNAVKDLKSKAVMRR